MAETLGQLVDRLGVTSELVEGILASDDAMFISDVVVIVRTYSEEKGPGVNIAWSNGMDWLTRRAMVEVARDQEVTFPHYRDEEG